MAEGSHRGQDNSMGTGHIGLVPACSVAAAAASSCHWVPVSRWMEVDTFSYRAVSSRCGSLSKPPRGPRVAWGCGKASAQAGPADSASLMWSFRFLTIW